MDQLNCVRCNKELKWGGFARNQDTCWGCVHDQALTILSQLNGEEREVFVWLMEVVAERYGYKFQLIIKKKERYI